MSVRFCYFEGLAFRFCMVRTTIPRTSYIRTSYDNADRGIGGIIISRLPRPESKEGGGAGI